MFQHSFTPPPSLHSPSSSDQSRCPSRDTTPTTPGVVAASLAPSSTKPTGLQSPLSWFQKPIDVGRTTTSLCLDSSLLRPDFDEHTFPQFSITPPTQRMAIGPSANETQLRQTSTSPRQPQISDLTTALKEGDSRASSTMNPPPPVAMDNSRSSLMPQDSSDMARFENGAKPISMKGRQSNMNRRESMANSLAMGMSWGGASVGSWIRDEYVLFYSLSPCLR